MGHPGQVRDDQVEQLGDLGIDGVQLALKCLPLLGHSQNLLGTCLIRQPEIAGLPPCAGFHKGMALVE
jgi:hypothetical protein